MVVVRVVFGMVGMVGFGTSMGVPRWCRDGIGWCSSADLGVTG